ncbi:cob(I)yrinic acid a,c-diamide adenosyltransferase [Marinilabiliaceae bacterium ANBcel2]|nr:cob(I)yrinic acid a,c-diamide adenosyltransferase [Marinilabiliaceae bacterium ANBcel2]
MNHKKSSVYTKTGDKGTTSLLGGTRVNKDNIRLEAYGTVDELNSYVGLIRSFKIDNDSKNTLLKIQEQLFTIGSYLATDEHVSSMREKLNIDENEILYLEKEMDRMEGNLPKLNNFILPGGNIAASQCHIARTIARRTERRIVTMAATTEIDLIIIKYINRLADYFFVLARFLSNYFDDNEIRWEPHLHD